MEMKCFLIVLVLSFLHGLNTKSFGQRISKEVLEKLSRVNSMSDFKREFNIREPNLKRTLNATAESNDGGESPECKPRRQVIRLGEEHPGHYIYYPSCTFAARCGGCCQPTMLRHCVSKVNETLFAPAYRISPDGSETVYMQVPYTNHKMCGCACIAKPSDCVGKQIFDTDNCRCECDVTEDQKQCSAEKQWSDIYCDCVCQRQDCPDSRKLNPTTCQCEPINVKDSTSFNVIHDDNPV